VFSGNSADHHKAEIDKSLRPVDSFVSWQASPNPDMILHTENHPARLRGVSSSVSSAVVSERFLNFLPNFARQFPEKDGEEARDRCRLHGIGFDFFDIPMNFPGIPISARLQKEPDALLSMRMKS
jgi:hypothetical protein